MSGSDFNLLSEPLIRATPCGPLSLPGVLAALVRDEVQSFPALRPHQPPAWRMFLVQLAALALHRGGRAELPRTTRVARPAARPHAEVPG